MFVTGLDLKPSSVRTVHQHLNTLFMAALDDGILLAKPFSMQPRIGSGRPSWAELDSVLVVDDETRVRDAIESSFVRAEDSLRTAGTLSDR